MHALLSTWTLDMLELIAFFYPAIRSRLPRK